MIKMSRNEEKARNIISICLEGIKDATERFDPRMSCVEMLELMDDIDEQKTEMRYNLLLILKLKAAENSIEI
jgi:hypothetical protein